jgi:4-hydroxybenzoate polyprenyltransferase
LALVHPFPSALNAVLVAALVLVAGGPASSAVVLGLAMLGLQFSIGAANDWFDVELDARTKPAKPIPAGLVARAMAAVVAGLGGGGGLALAVAGAGPGGWRTVACALGMLGAGLAYDARLKRSAFSWLPFAVAFPLLPLYAWFGAVGTPPPAWQLLLPIAFLAGPMLQLANGLVDVEGDIAGGARGLVTRLGRRRAWSALLVLQVGINAFATVVVLNAGGGLPATAMILLAFSLALVGVGLSGARAAQRREWGWRLQAGALALLAVGWLAWANAGAGPAAGG